MIKRFLRYIRVPNIDNQNTGHYAYQLGQGKARTSVNGGAGIATLRTLRATNPGTVTPGQTLVNRDPSQTGNPSRGLVLRPLTEENSLQSI